jgi:hypothetical protein
MLRSLAITAALFLSSPSPDLGHAPPTARRIAFDHILVDGVDIASVEPPFVGADVVIGEPDSGGNAHSRGSMGEVVFRVDPGRDVTVSALVQVSRDPIRNELYTLHVPFDRRNQLDYRVYLYLIAARDLNQTVSDTNATLSERVDSFMRMQARIDSEQGHE